MGLIGQEGGLRVRGPDGESQPAQSQIYYMLTASHPANHLHWLEGCDTHILLEGGASAAATVRVCFGSLHRLEQPIMVAVDG